MIILLQPNLKDAEDDNEHFTHQQEPREDEDEDENFPPGENAIHSVVGAFEETGTSNQTGCIVRASQKNGRKPQSCK